MTLIIFLQIPNGKLVDSLNWSVNRNWVG